MPKITALGNGSAVWIVAAGALTISKRYRRYGIAMLATLTAVSRLYLYVHFPLDVLAAAVLGIAIGLAAWPMTPPAAYGLFLILGLGGSALAAYMMRRCGAVCCRRILLGVGLFLICYETYKLLFYYKGARPFVEVPASCIARSII